MVPAETQQATGSSTQLDGLGIVASTNVPEILIVNASADTSLPNNPMGQDPRIHFPSFIDICDYELEKLNREDETLWKTFEETTSELKAELGRKMAEAHKEYDRKSQDLDAAYNAQTKKEEGNQSLVAMNCLLAKAFKSKCTDTSAATNTAAVVARSSQHSTHQQRAVHTNTHMNSTTLPRFSIPAPEAPIPNLSGPELHSPRCNMTQPRSISQQAAVYMNSAAHSRPSFTAEDAPIQNLSSHLLHFPRCNTALPRPISQQATIQSNTHMNSTASLRISVTAMEAPIPNHSGPLSHFPRCNTTPARPISPQAAIQSNTYMNSTASPQPSITAVAIPLHSPRINTRQPRSPPLLFNQTPSSYSAAPAPPPHGVVRAMAPHLRSFRAPNSSSASTTYPTRLVQEQQQQQENSNSG